MKNNLTASERRGVIAVAVIALLITACALLLGRCGHSEPASSFPEPEILMQPGDDANAEDSAAASGKKARKARRAKKKQQKDSTTRKPRGHNKEWGRRSPLDEINGKK